MLSALGAGAFVLVVALGAWGWTDHEESASRHASAVRIKPKDKQRFCEYLGFTVASLTGQQPTPGLPPGLGLEPPTDQDLVQQADFIISAAVPQLLPSAPPVLVPDIENVAEASEEVISSRSADAFRSGRVVGSIKNLGRYYILECG